MVSLSLFCLLWTGTNSGTAFAQGGPVFGSIDYVAVEQVPEIAIVLEGTNATAALVADDLNFNVRLGGGFGAPQPTTVIQMGMYERNATTG